MLGRVDRVITNGFFKMVKSRNLLITKHFEGEPKESDFKLVEEELPALKDGG